MAALPEDPTWESEIYQLEDTDPVSGGTPNLAIGDGMDNVPHQQLARRTSWLKAQVDALLLSVVEATTAVAGIVRLSTSTSSTSTTLAATPSAVKAAYDNAESRVPNARLVATSGLASGGGNLGADRTIDVPISTQAEAEAGAINTKAMTPLRVAQLIAKRIADGVAQAGSDILTAISALATTGMIVRTGAGAVVTRSIAGSGGITVTNGNGVAGNPTVSLNGQVAALDTLAASGLIARTAADTVAARTINGSAGVTVTNGNGVAGNPVIGLDWYQSADLTMVNGGAITLTHGLGAIPKFVTARIKCVVAEAGYAVGDVVQVAFWQDANNQNEGLSALVSASSIIVRVSDNGPPPITKKGNGEAVIVPAANWKLIIGALA